MLALVALFLGIQSRGANVTIEWDPSLDSELSEYRVYRGIAPGLLNWKVSVSVLTTRATFTDLIAGQTYFFAVTAVAKDGTESDLSNIIAYTAPFPLSSTLVAGNVSARTLEDSSVNILLTGFNLLLGPLRYEIVASPGHGQISGTAPSLVYKPAPNFFGTDQFTYRVSDGLFASATATVSISVEPVNDPPTLDPIANLLIAENAGPQTIALTGLSSGAVNERQALTVTAFSSNPALIPNPIVTYASPDSVRYIRIAPAADMNGTATITVSVHDDGASNNVVERTFTVSVNPAPRVTDLVQTAGDARSVTLSWKTDLNAKCFINYGLTTNLCLTSAATVGVTHSMTLSNLAPASTYFVQIVAHANGISSQTEVWTIATDPREVLSIDAKRAVSPIAFNIQTESTYRLWARVKSPSGAGSFYFTVDNLPETLVSVASADADWNWVLLTRADTSATNSLALPIVEGPHSLVICAADADTQIDAFAVVNDPDWRPAPSLSIQAATENSVTLAWKINTTHFSDAVIESSIDGLNFYPKAIVIGQQGVGRIENLGRKKTYYFRLGIVESDLQRRYSNVVVR